MAEITSPDYPGERLVVCKNPLLAEERARKRDELLAATEKDLARLQARVRRARNPLRGAAAIGQALGTVFRQRRMAKHFTTTITGDSFSFTRKPRLDRRRSGTRWHLCGAHQPDSSSGRCREYRACL